MFMLRALLAERNLSIAEFIRQSGLSRRTVEGILKREDCRLSTARVIADTLGCTLDELYPSQQSQQ